MGKTSIETPWAIHFFRRHKNDDPAETTPAKNFLVAVCPVGVRAKLVAILKAVAEAPPPRFGGGGMWEAMHDDMAGYYEARADGPGRRHYRLFCVLERNGSTVGLGGSSLVVLTGKDKPFRTVLSRADYADVRSLGAEYRRRNPRSVER